jgi:mono/diheme cytochrome c family protein/glucose/arabinose dehydrogenase/type 1 glutamine amidotransferase/lysophospholipase L1-like esterase
MEEHVVQKLSLLVCLVWGLQVAAQSDYLHFAGGDGPGKGKHVVLLAGDEEYRSEEAMPLMAQILNKQGFECTVLFSMNGEIVDPNAGGSLSNPAALDAADAIIMALRFRHWDDAAMQKFDDALNRGVPIVALRTSTHAFNGLKGKWAKYNFNAKGEWDRGFGRQVLGETWVNHHGRHKVEGCRGIVEKGAAGNPLLTGVGEIFGDTDVYGAHPPADVKILLRGQVTKTLDPKSAAVDGKKNDPMMPIAWTRTWQKNRIFTTTMGSSSDLADPDLRRLIANATFWALSLEIPKDIDVSAPGYKPSPYSFNGFRKNQKPSDFLLADLPQPSTAAAITPKPAPTAAPGQLTLKQGSRVCLVGNGLASRMVHFGHFETALHLQNPDKQLVIRNMGDEGNTPSFRPHSGRGDQLGFPGADKFYHPYADGNTANGVGHLETDEQWLKMLKPDIILAFFGFNEAFLGAANLANYRAELDAFLKHTLNTSYNGANPPQLALVSPIAFEDRSADMDLPNGKRENRRLAAYTAAMQEVAGENGVLFVDVFNPSLEWYRNNDKPLTADGALMNSDGYKTLSWYLVDQIFGLNPAHAAANQTKVHAAVTEKNWFWTNDFKVPNGVHVFGRRYKPYGPQNYPDEIKKIREMTAIRDQAIWAALKGKTIDIAALDAKTHQLPAVPTNYTPQNSKAGPLEFLKGDEALSKLVVPEGYKVEQFATEQEFPDLANPVQIAFDNKGRLWIATMPSYPHYRPGDPMPDDKLIILEDTDGDGKADKQTTWADKLHLPMGFEFAPEGVYVSQGVNLVLLSDSDGDDKADSKEIIFSGFDDHDTHHAISAYCADPSGAIFMCEGVFLRTNVETPYGTVRGTDGGFYRFSPQKRHLERHSQLSIPNPWGVAFDGWGQHFFLHTSGTRVEWMLPSSVKPRYGVKNPNSQDLISNNKVRPTSGIEFLHSRHFPDEVQGDMMLCNSIGFLGIKQHKVSEDGTGYKTEYRQDLIVSQGDGNFRPVDLEIAPDGSLYVVDWHNPLIGHMQHNARDPHRDHSHGRIYRITYPSRPLVKPAQVAGAPIPVLLDNLKLPEYRTRYRSRRELRARNVDEVLAALKPWVASLDKTDARYDHHLLEALWVTWGLNKIDPALVEQCLASGDHRARAAAVRVLRYADKQVPKRIALLKKAAADPHGRVHMEVLTAASWAGKNAGLDILEIVANSQGGDKAEELPSSPEAKVAYKGRQIIISDPKIAKADITRIELALPQGGTINLSELQVFSGDKNLANTANYSMSSTYGTGQYPGKLLADGNKDNFAHTAEGDKKPWIKADFPIPVNIDQLVIHNREGFESRFDGGTVTFFAGDKRVAGMKLKIKGSSAPAGGGDKRVSDPWLSKPYANALAHLKGETVIEEPEATYSTTLKGADKKTFEHGSEIYMKEGHCGTCHQLDGKGLPAAGFPPLDGAKWVTQDLDRLIKLTLNGLHGPIEVKGKQYPGLVPMTPFGGILNDADIAAVLTFVRNSFGNKASVVKPADVARVRAATASKVGFYNPAELLEQHPHK